MDSGQSHKPDAVLAVAVAVVALTPAIVVSPLATLLLLLRIRLLLSSRHLLLLLPFLLGFLARVAGLRLNGVLVQLVKTLRIELGEF